MACTKKKEADESDQSKTAEYCNVDVQTSKRNRVGLSVQAYQTTNEFTEFVVGIAHGMRNVAGEQGASCSTRFFQSGCATIALLNQPLHMIYRGGRNGGAACTGQISKRGAE